MDPIFRDFIQKNMALSIENFKTSRIEKIRFSHGNPQFFYVIFQFKLKIRFTRTGYRIISDKIGQIEVVEVEIFYPYTVCVVPTHR